MIAAVASIIGGFIALFGAALVLTAPYTYLLMLALGNLHLVHNPGYLDCIPAGFLLVMLSGGKNGLRNLT